MSDGSHFIRSVLCDLRIGIFQYGQGNQTINRYYCHANFFLYAKGRLTYRFFHPKHLLDALRVGALQVDALKISKKLIFDTETNFCNLSVFLSLCC